MSMEICVLSTSRLNSIAEWQRSIDAEKLPLRFPEGQLLEVTGGNLVIQLNAKSTRIEYSFLKVEELRNVYKTIDLGCEWKYAVAFIWSSNFDEEIAAWMAAAAYARAMDGVVFDEQEGLVLTAEESLRIARDVDRRRPAMEATLAEYIDQLAAKSPGAKAAVESFMQRRSSKPD